MRLMLSIPINVNQQVMGVFFLDKIAIGFMADILYIKGFICYEEFQSILDARTAGDLDGIIDKMLRGEFNGHKKGEGYITDVRGRS